MWTFIAQFIAFPMVVAPFAFQGESLARHGKANSNFWQSLLEMGSEFLTRVFTVGTIFAPPTLCTCLMAYGLRHIPVDNYPSVWDAAVGVPLGLVAIFGAMQVLPPSKAKADPPRRLRPGTSWRDDVPASHHLHIGRRD